MPSWNESEYIKRAQELASQHVISKKSLNDLAEKVARDQSMNPDEIRTLVRLANVAAFNEYFKGKPPGSPDRMVEFETGDPEAVIQRIVQGAGAEPQSANISNDKMASETEIPDMMRDVRRGFADEAVKVASYEDVPERVPRRSGAIVSLRRLVDDFEVEQQIEGNRWEEKLGALALRFRRATADAPVFAEFEKDAYAALGADAYPELVGLRQFLKLAAAPIMPMDKIAYYQDHRVAPASEEQRLLTAAVAARTAYVKISEAHAHVTQELAKTGA